MDTCTYLGSPRPFSRVRSRRISTGECTHRRAHAGLSGVARHEGPVFPPGTPIRCTISVACEVCGVCDSTNLPRGDTGGFPSRRGRQAPESNVWGSLGPRSTIRCRLVGSVASCVPQQLTQGRPGCRRVRKGVRALRRYLDLKHAIPPETRAALIAVLYKVAPWRPPCVAAARRCTREQRPARARVPTRGECGGRR